jgi:hypothetical protein
MVGSPDRLTSDERRRVAYAALGPVLLAVVVLTPVALVTGATAGDVAGGAVVYGGMLGLAAAFVAVDRLQARQCPACHRRQARGARRCDCGYDVAARPRYACERRHAIYLEDGICGCGAPLRRLKTARGVGPQVVVALRIGAYLLAFLVVVGLAIYLIEGRL